MNDLIHTDFNRSFFVYFFFLLVSPTQKYKLVYFRYIQDSYEILELEKKKKSEV